MNRNSVYPLTPASLKDLEDLVGQTLGPTPWHAVTQAGIDAFADATGDRQWIHVDPERAAASPLGTTIAHGLYTLSLGPAFSYQLMSFDGFTHALNYGYDKIRFPALLPTGNRVRMSMTVLSVTQTARGVEFRNQQSFQREGEDRPVAVAESVSLIAV